ncbi:hypothetical protein [Ramlibacter sp.]|uniref:hypothetical protein n=1 Tax=Ramlibacter sp. TaxID=1917967 RepID=UPI00261CD412|nr:hypothetical protein [Ramlibacter sp.]MDB5957291.1 hypothetical protein [Ramlibacter sp.]
MAIEFASAANAVKQFEAITAIFSVLAALFAGYAAWLSYRLAKSIRDELKSDEVLVVGVLHNADLAHPDHRNAVVQTTLFNKSKRKVYVSRVLANDEHGRDIEVDWGPRIDAYGNVQDGNAQLIGITDSAQLCVRRRDGLAFRQLTLHVWHSFGKTPLTLRYSIEPGWQDYFAR